jgi:hypothetical protein
MTLVLRDMVFMMMIVSAIFVLSGLFVSEMAFNYENDNMSSEWALKGTNTLANSTFYSTGQNVSDVGVDMGDAGSYNYYYQKTGALITGTNAVVTAATVTAVDDAANAQLVLHLTENSTYDTTYWGQISIRVWFEGWDAEAYNSLLGKMITTSFSFEGASI